MYDIEELEKVEQLRNHLKDVLPLEMYNDTHYIIKFLRARNKDVKSAELMLRKNIEWRKKNKLDTMLSWFKPLEVQHKYCGLNNIGFAKDGSSVLYSNVGLMDLRGLLMSTTHKQGVDYITHFLEREIKILKDQTEKLNKLVDQFIIILNFESYSLTSATHKPSLELVAEIVSIYERNFPECLRKALIINSSWLFQLLFTFVKPLITGNTLQKIHIYGKDGWREEILKDVDAEVLPAFLGGTRTDPDGNPMCYSFVNHCAPVPESYYGINNKKIFESLPDIKKFTIHRVSKKEVELNVVYPDSMIEWEFQTKNRDIAVSLLYKENKTSNIKEVLPKNRYDTSICTETGLYKCEKPGLYYLEFDNSYSWMHQKEVFFRVKVVPPHLHNIKNDGA